MDAFTKDMEKLSAKKPAPKAAASQDDEVLFLRSGKRKGSSRSTPSVPDKKTRASGSTVKASLQPCVYLSKVLADLSSKMFPDSACFLPSGDISKAIESVQFDLLHVCHSLSLCFCCMCK